MRMTPLKAKPKSVVDEAISSHLQSMSTLWHPGEVALYDDLRGYFEQCCVEIVLHHGGCPVGWSDNVSFVIRSPACLVPDPI